MTSTSNLITAKFLFNDRRGKRTRKSSLLYILLLVSICCAVFASAVSAGYMGTRFISNRSKAAKATSPLKKSDNPIKAVAVTSGAQDPVPLPPLTTDKTGYLFGETVNISGNGFAAGESVTIQVKHANGSAESGAGHEPFAVTAQPDGTVTTTWNLNHNESAGNDFIATAVGSSSGASGSAAFRRIATVRTDKFDYKQGESVAIQGRGFAPGESVSIQVIHLNGRPDGNGYSPFATGADGNGEISTSWVVDPTALDSILLLTATGTTSGLRAQTIFTDVVVTVIDDAGADDEPGQKDLNQLSTDKGNLPTSMAVTWNWDDTAWTGGNTGDACSLFDTDGDGFANFTLCVTVGGNPATYQSTRLFSCGDTRSDRCDQPTVLISTFTSTCTATIVANSDPFSNVPSHTQNNSCDNNPGCETDDTVAACTIRLADFGSSNASLLNVCTYPSGEPNSAPAECVITPNSGFLTIRKTTETSDSVATNFVFNTSVASQAGVSSFSKSITGAMTNDVVANMVSFAPGTINISEVVPTDWDLTSASCTVQSNIPTSTGTFSGDTISGVSIQSGLETICTFTDSKKPKLTVTKVVVNDNGGTKQISDFPLFVDSNSVTSGQQITSTVGSHTVSETTDAGYTSTIGGDCASNGSITLAAGDVKECTITNDDKPATLKIIKHVINDNGGTAVAADFTLDSGGTNDSPDNFAGAEGPGGTDVTLDAGSYTVSESGPSGYSASYSADCSGTIGVGESKTC
ncbi:MAG TPA: hypothetical protein VLA93_14695, partial [Pyrinomonadaceae bacterium]|nr:hypothetical protein [Pyrinomonadaceae bacterium]